MQDVKQIVSHMTLEEKVSLCSGLNFWNTKPIERFGIPSIMMTDGPHGLRKQIDDHEDVGLTDSVPATCFPTASAMASTWNRDLIRQVGNALGNECRAEDVAVILGPGVNIKRSPLCGRNFEYFSEDPFLAGEMAASLVEGIQQLGVGASLKHFAVNNQETRRMLIDAVLDERALREIYLAPFERAVRKARPWTVMCAYNKVNGVYCSDHERLLTSILRDEWGFEGLVVSDWGAVNNRVEGIKAGLDLEMPGPSNSNDALIVNAVRSGILEEEKLDASVERIFNLVIKAGKTDGKDSACDLDANHALARKVAGEGVVLLKNEKNILPLKKGVRIALVGRFALTPRYQGSGSSLVNPTRMDNLYDELLDWEDCASLVYAAGYTQLGDAADEKLIGEALGIARQADVVVACVGLPDRYEVEGVDRDHMKLPPGHDELIMRLADACEHLVVVLSNGSPVEMPWINEVGAVLEGYLGGQAGAGAIADILTGRVNPSGKLSESFPIRLEDNPSFRHFPGGPATVEYRESLYVGYRFYDSVHKDVLFPFGYGLSYTTFKYSDLNLSRENVKGEEAVSVSFKVRNSGSCEGMEIAQLYVHPVNPAVFRPEKELKGFEKITLQPGEEQEVKIELGMREFAHYDPGLPGWRINGGEYEILVGASSRDIRLQGRLTHDSYPQDAPPEQEYPTVYANFPSDGNVDREAFESLLGRALPHNKMAQKGEYDLNTPLRDMGSSLVAKGLYSYIRSEMRKRIKGQEDSPTALMMEKMITEMPLRSILTFAGDTLDRGVVENLLVMINGHFWKGLKGVLRESKKK